MAVQQYYQRRPSRRQDDDTEDAPDQSSFQSSDESQRVSDDASHTLSNIDDALRENEKNPSKADYEQRFNAIPGAERALGKLNTAPQKRYDSSSNVLGGLKKEETSGGNPTSSAMDGLYNMGSIASGGALKQGKKIAGFLGGGLITLVLILTITFMFEAFKSKIFSHFMDRFYGAVSHRLIKHRGFVFLDRWIKLDILTAAKVCGSTVDLNCVNSNHGQQPEGIFGRFVAAYRNKQVAELFKEEGIIFKYEGGNYILTTKLGDSDPVSEGDLADKRFDQVFNSKFDVYNAVTQALEKHGTIDRRSKRLVARVLKKQFGARMCLLYCNIRKSLEQRGLSVAEKLDNFRNAIISAIGRRVIDAGIARQVILLECLTAQLNCSDADAVKARLHEINTEDAFRLLNTPAALDELIDDGVQLKEHRKTLVDKGKSLAEIGFERVLIKILGKEAGKIAAKIAIDSIPLVGWIIAATQMGVLIHDFVELINDSSGNHTLRNIWAEMKIAQSVQAFSIISASGDEAEGVGAAVGGGYDIAATAAMAERLRGIEQAKFYQYTFGSLAHEGNYKGHPDTGEQCRVPFTNDEFVPPSADETFCPEMKLDRDPAIIKALTDPDNINEKLGPWGAALFKILTLGILIQTSLIKETIGRVVGLINTVLDWVFKVLFDDTGLLNLALKLLKAIPGVADVIAIVEQVAKDFILGIFAYVLPLNFRDETEVKGPRLAGSAAVGADFSYNYQLNKGGKDDETEQTYGLGGRLLTQEESDKLYSQVAQEENSRFKSLSFFDRFFSTDEPSSLLSRLIMVDPASPISNPDTMVASITNPFNNLFGFVTDRMVTGPAYAQTVGGAVKRVGQASTGVPQYGYTDDDPMLDAEPSTTKAEDCRDEREADGVDDIGRDKYTTTVQCMLDKETVDVWAAPYDTQAIGAK